jgi:regulator of RNase E activity RraA
VVLQDEDQPPGLGAFVGEVHANILRALGCTALVTNGAVRDLQGVRASGFQLFAGNVSVSHAYAHISSFGDTVEVGRLKIRPGDLLLGDLHGVVSIPAEIAEQLPAAARGILRRREHLIGLCRAEKFSLEQLEAAQQDLNKMELQEAAMQNTNSKRGAS